MKEVMCVKTLNIIETVTEYLISAAMTIDLKLKRCFLYNPTQNYGSSPVRKNNYTNNIFLSELFDPEAKNR